MALRAHFDSNPVTWERVGYELEKVLDKDAVIVPELGTQYYKIYRQPKLGRSNKQRMGNGRVQKFRPRPGARPELLVGKPPAARP
jgi:hypothetical protein